MNSKLKNLIFTCAGKGARIPFVNSLRLRGAKLSVNRSIVLHTHIDCKGKNNTIYFEDGCILNKCRINIRGDNNEIYFHKGICAEFTELWIEDDNNQIVIGENTGLYGPIHLACIEGTSIKFGTDCLCSSDVVVRTGDSHSVLDGKGNRSNPSMDVVIGNHVWIRNRAILLKGVHIPNDCIIGTASVVTKRFEEEHVCIAGVPAKIVKRDVSWNPKRLPIGE